MTDTNERHSHVAGFNRDEAYLDTLKSRMPETDKLFTALAQGITPNFLDIMKVLSEMSLLYPESDQSEDDHKMPCQNMSQKICRFCS